MSFLYKIPLKQHIGSPSAPIVEIGQKVIKGQLIAMIDDNKLGANIHASINGVVSKITNQYIYIKSEG